MLRFSRRFGRRSLVFGLGLFGLLGSQVAVAGDNTWTGAASMIWNTTASNWTTPLVWNNANGDGAIFGGNALGAISVPGPINVNSLDFPVTGYSLTGAGPLTFVDGTSTQTTGVINVAGGTTTIGVPINSSVTAVQKIGAGVLELSQPVNITASFPLTFSGNLSANLLIGPAPFGQSPVGGTVRVLNSSVLPSTISVGLGGGGILDIGANNVTIGQLTFTNQNSGIDYPNYGVIGTGTLRVTGEINVVGQGFDNFGNAISTPLNLGGGTQIVRSAAVTFFSGPANLMFFGPLSNGSLLKVPGYRDGGTIGGVDGIALLANNTYAGSTVINGGTLGSSLATGTNASTSLQVYGAAFSVQGVDGSYGAANTIQVFAGGSLALDNNASFGGGAGIPSFPAANNGNRISDTAAVTLRDGTFVYRGLSTAASSETFGSLNLAGGNNVVTVAPTGAGGTASLTATGNLTMDPRSTMQISASSTVLGTTGSLKFGGTVPAAVGGIIPRIASTSDFVFYDTTNGFSPLTTYSPTVTAGTNVALSAATSVPASVAINALKTTASLTTTIDPAAVLTVNTGMMLAASGTHTITGGTLAFGASPGTFFGTHTISSAITGTQGLLVASGTTTLTGDLAGLTGTLSNIGAGTLTLSGTAANFPGAIENRRSTLNINSNSTGGAITLGVAANDFNLLGTVPRLSISGAGAGAVINRPIVVDNGGNNAAGLSLLTFSFQPTIAPLSNSTGSQTIAGNITLNTSVSLQGGGGSGTGATIFSGNIAGPGTFILANGRANFTGDLSNAGGMLVAFGGFTGIANLQGTITGNYPIVMNAGSTNTSGISYSTQANLGSSTITVQNSSGVNAPSIFALQTGSINNSITLNGDVTGNAATGVTATWTGPMTGTGGIFKNGAGTLVLPNAKTYSGNTTVSAGTLQLSGAGSFANSPTVTVASTAASSAGVILDVSGISSGANFDSSTFAGGSFTLATGQTLKGFGTVSGKTVVKNGTGVGPGASESPNLIGTLTFDNSVFLGGSYEVDVASTGSQRGDQIVLSNGGMTIDPSASLVFPASNTYDNSTVIPLITVNGGGLLSGTFVGAVAPTGYNLVYTSTSLLLTPVPEPGTLLLAGMAAAGGFGVWRRKRAGKKVAG